MPSDPHQMPLDGSPAVHQSTHFDQETLLVLSSPCGVRSIVAEPLPLGDTSHREVEPFAFVSKAMEFRDQLLLIHLVQARHHPWTLSKLPAQLSSAIGITLLSILGDMVTYLEKDRSGSKSDEQQMK
ncbi:hypothetical protein [Microvirga sp. VF16]|uniref:hypothetical protein n=1 Tax=Microvirga sp. VF16 TaxID=2807101 RepID=UPI00193D97FF|nr:hypothetical protein [Microvirga sp. VF16]QRM34187.1 hypothetical protein JO965_33565 [Microvirga sp. VF16]